MKRKLAVVLAMSMTILSMAACGNSGGSGTKEASKGEEKTEDG